jgi:NAD-dependent deacetylase
MRRMEQQLGQARRWIATANRVVALTGAGVSAESGIPTFRGDGGLWKNYRAEELATPEAFRRDPKLVWEWYDWRRQIIAKAEPNAAHVALAQCPKLTLITQNVDGLHDRAGSRDALKVHGDIWTVRCVHCGKACVDRTVPLPQIPPRCAECGGLLRPGVVWFGEDLPQEVWTGAVEASSRADVFLIVGTSAQVYPAASLAPLAKRHAGAKIVEVNICASGAAVDLFLEGKAGTVLPSLFAPEYLNSKA